MDDLFLKNLNPEQREAALHTNGPLLILAGAGSGKTTVLVARAGRLVSSGFVSAEKLCVLTFTNKAARELKDRVSDKLGKSGKKIWAGTFHSFGLWLLRKYHKRFRLNSHFAILDTSDSNHLVKELLSDFRHGAKSGFDIDRIQFLLSQFREAGRRMATKDDEYEAAVEWLLPRYEQKLQSLGMVDFDSLILKPVQLMKDDAKTREEIQALFDQVMVDEFQDTNKVQMQLVQQISDSHKNLAVVGDDDQSIYGWRGACIKNILDFPKLYDNCKVIRLERNYRSTPKILALANQIISQNTERHPKVLKAENAAEGAVLPEIFILESEEEEAEFVSHEIQTLIGKGSAKRDIAVIYRSNSQGSFLEAELRKNQIPYLMSGGTAFFDRKETKDLLAYLRCCLTPNEIAFRRILNTPPRGIGDKTIERLTETSELQARTFLATVRDWRLIEEFESRAGESIDHLFQELTTLRENLIRGTETVHRAFLLFFEALGYKAYLERSSGNALMASKRWRFVETFGSILDRYLAKSGRTEAGLKNFLDAMELRDALNDKEEKEDRVQLLTLHACKGLEFPHVFLIGVEEDILPHKTLGTEIAEERRLFYVGVTRAKERLILSRCRKRKRHGKMVDAAPSRFLLEISPTLFNSREGSRPVEESKRKAMIAELFNKLDNLQVPRPPSTSA